MPNNKLERGCIPPPKSTVFGSFMQFCGVAFIAFPEMLKERSIFENMRKNIPGLKAVFAESGVDDSALTALLAELASMANEDPEKGECGRQNFAEYNRLFISPEPPVPMWESLWLSNEKIHFTRETDDVRAFYHRFGLPIAQYQREAEDHLGYELAFAGILFDLSNSDNLSAEKRQEALEAFDDFLQKHLLRWAPKALEKLAEEAKTAFWKNLFILAGQLFFVISPEENI